MSTNTRIMSTTPDRVWDVLADGWLFPLWVVGASRIREVDAAWPAVGSKIHHSVGVWPLLVDDNTEVTACEPGRLLSLRARVWPAGSADVTLRLSRGGRVTPRWSSRRTSSTAPHAGAQAGADAPAGVAQRRVAAPARLPRRAPGLLSRVVR